MLSGILSAASVADRQMVVSKLDQRVLTSHEMFPKGPSTPSKNVFWGGGLNPF